MRGENIEKIIVIEPLQKRFVVQLKDANKEKRNRSYASASDCCGQKLKQEKFCSACMAKAEGKTHRKIVKVGKEEHLIDAEMLDNALEQFESVEELSLHTFLPSMPEGAEELFDSLVYGLPAEKKEAQYKELVEILRGRVAVGKGVFRNNEFQVIATVVGNRLHVRKLVDVSQKYEIEFDSSTLENVKLNDKIVELENSILDKKMQSSFDLLAFRDSRQVVEEQMIAELVLNGKVKTFAPVVKEQKEQDELARLQALAEGK